MRMMSLNEEKWLGGSMDLRIKKTYQALIGSFTALLSERPYEDISVAALCDRATIRRTTFYKHFKDKDDFFAFFIRSLRLGMTAGGESGIDELDVRSETALVGRVQVIGELASFLVDHQAMMDNVIKSSASGTLFEVIGENLAKAVRCRYPVLGDVPEKAERLDVAAEFAAGGITRLMHEWWARGDVRQNREDFVRSVDELVGFVMDGATAAME